MPFEITAAMVVPFLFVVTIAAVAIFAFVSKRKTEERLHDDSAQKSTLASDAPNKR